MRDTQYKIEPSEADFRNNLARAAWEARLESKVDDIRAFCGLVVIVAVAWALIWVAC